jgi:hypothetical protein
MTTSLPPELRQLARFAADAFGAPLPRVAVHPPAAGRDDVHVLAAPDRPRAGLASWATAGLALHRPPGPARTPETRVELVAVTTAAADFAPVLAAAARQVAQAGWRVAPGVVFAGVVAAQGLSTTLSDLFFVRPDLWGDLLAPVPWGEGGRLRLSWLRALPVSQAESAFAQAYGPERLQALLAERGADLSDLARPSAA